ncbi:hypothetical protein QFW77_02145 [Luteimonas sp. RD2P54]|uniref:Uridine kinase n=1 Tax=Luteimonas endophytica TaxID=3042023 RepID=A0ABT6J6I2_9GAMM|nr:hypothetical protein [Luteimonas endophytica]MDH5821798.1 hypothetical protein [Luteimonas endophytica]
MDSVLTVRSESELTSLIGGLDHAGIVGIDGLTASGKSWAAHQLCSKLGWPIIGCDSFVRNGKLFYPQILDLAALKSALEHAQRPVLVEGVMLRLVLQAIGFSATHNVYVRRCNIDGSLCSPEFFESFSAADMMAAENELCRLIGIKDNEPILARELISYHEAFRPYESADIVFDNSYGGS